MNKRQLKALFLTVLLISPVCSFARFPGILKRFQLGYSFVSNKADYTSTFRSSLLGIDTSYAGTEMKTTAAWGFTAGTYFPLKRLGNASALVLGVDYMYNLMTWKSDLPGGLDNTGGYTFDGATAQMALPIGLDLKFGADALQLRTFRLCGTVGAGVYPSYSATTLNGLPFTIDPVFSVAPYVKAEVGFYAGFCMKVRALYAIGDITYMDYKNTTNSGGGEFNSTAKLVGKSNLAISLLIMPFSYKWDREEWWNTY